MLQLPWNKEPEKKNPSPEQESLSVLQGSVGNDHLGGAGAEPAFDPLREKLRREEAGETGSAGGPKEEAERLQAEENLAQKNVRKAEFFTRVILGGLSLAMKEVSKVRGDHWRLTDPEKQEVGDALFPVTLKYVEKVWVPVWLDRYQEEMGLAWALVCVLYAKMEIDGKIVEAQSQEAAGSGQKENL